MSRCLSPLQAVTTALYMVRDEQRATATASKATTTAATTTTTTLPATVASAGKIAAEHQQQCSGDHSSGCDADGHCSHWDGCRSTFIKHIERSLCTFTEIHTSHNQVHPM